MDLDVIGIGARVEHPAFGRGVVYDLDQRTFYIFFGGEQGEQTISRSFTGLQLVEPGPDLAGGDELDLDTVKDALREVLAEMDRPRRPVELARRYEGGTLELKPSDPELKSKELPIEDFFHKIVMLRDRLRVLEQKINAHEVLSEADKVELQQYVTRCYGSLTTFNVLFADKEDHFVGQKGG